MPHPWLVALVFSAIDDLVTRRWIWDTRLVVSARRSVATRSQLEIRDMGYVQTTSTPSVVMQTLSGNAVSTVYNLLSSATHRPKGIESVHLQFALNGTGPVNDLAVPVTATTAALLYNSRLPCRVEVIQIAERAQSRGQPAPPGNPTKRDLRFC